MADQSYKNWECLVVDDMSTDDTKDVLDVLFATDPRFRYHKNLHAKGAPGARNTGLELSKGSLIFFLDSDDILLPHCLEARCKYFLEDPSVDILVGMQKKMDNGTETFFVNVPSQTHPLVRFYSLYPFVDIPWINNSLLIKRAFIDTNNIRWDESFTLYQDIQFNMSLLMNAPVVVWSEQPFDAYWVHESAQESIGKKKQDFLAVTKRLFELYWQQLNDPDLASDLLRSLKKQYHAALLHVGLMTAGSREIQYGSYLEQIKRSSDFSAFDIFLIKRNGCLSRIHDRKYLHRFFSKWIKRYLLSKYEPVITHGTFLKIKTLNDPPTG